MRMDVLTVPHRPMFAKSFLTHGEGIWAGHSCETMWLEHQRDRPAARVP